MRHSLIAAINALVVLILQGCAGQSVSENRWKFTCLDGYQFSVSFSAEGSTAVLESEASKTELVRTPSAGGARYSDGMTTFWSIGTTGRIDWGDKIIHQDCPGRKVK